LQKDDRLSLAELGKSVGLAPSSVNERIKRLTTRGVIEGFHAHVVPESLGLDLLAFVFVGWSNPATEAPFLARVAAAPAVLECHHVTGSWNYLLKVRLPNTARPRALPRPGREGGAGGGAHRDDHRAFLRQGDHDLISDPLGQQS
jgi:DNA-binding Lrp family transcriptional regulator